MNIAKTKVRQRWIHFGSKLIIEIVNSENGEAIVIQESIWRGNVPKGNSGHWSNMYVNFWKLLPNQDKV
jgi:hypothetical protein